LRAQAVLPDAGRAAPRRPGVSHRLKPLSPTVDIGCTTHEREPMNPGASLFLALVFGIAGHNEAKRFEKRYGRTPFGWRAYVWGIICFLSFLIGLVLLAIAERIGRKAAANASMYGQAYAQPVYAQPGYGPAPYGSAPYGSAPYGPPTYAPPGYAPPEYGQPAPDFTAIDCHARPCAGSAKRPATLCGVHVRCRRSGLACRPCPDPPSPQPGRPIAAANAVGNR
jgi:hypothetical protein